MMLRALLLCATLAAPALAQRPDSLPLEPTRRLRYTADEGTWMSLDVSPDGRTIVFELLGDLYTMPITGGRATRITAGMAFDAQPRWAPDGRSLVFVSDRSGADNVWIANADGSDARAITRDERTMFISPEWTPDGNYVVVSRSTEIVNRPSTFDLVMYHRSGSGGVPLTGPRLASNAASDSAMPRPRAVLGVAFGGDARHAWVAMANTARGYGGPQIGLLERATGRLYRRTEEIGGAFRPVASPDGKWLVYGTRKDGVTVLKLVDLASGDERVLVDAVDRDNMEGTPTRDYLPGASFTPDSRALVASYRGKFWRVEVADGRATPIPFTADVDIGLGPLARFDYSAPDSVVTARRIEHPRRSPDGRMLAFSALARLWVAPLGAAGEPRLLDDANDAFFPAWSPDGRWIAYVTWDDSAGGHVYRVRADGSARPERLTRQPAFYERLAWAPDGARIVVARGPRQQRIEFFDELRTGRPQAREFVWIPASGGDATVITPINTAARYASQHYGIPHFTNDSSRIWFTDPFEGLVSVRWDGSDRRVHLRVNGWDWTRNPPGLADEILVSPDGSHALALVNAQAWLLDIPPTGERLPTIFLPSSGPAPLPARRLTTVGADFIEWGADGKTAHWAIGGAFHTYDLTAAAPRGTRQVAVRIPRDVPRGTVVLRGARVVTMKGDEVIENADLVVVDNRIAALGARGSVSLPAGARTIDVTGKTIIPGYVDIHAHMWAPWGVHRKQVWEYLANLAYGVTTTRDPQTMTPDVITYADEVEAGSIIGPRIFSTSRGIFAGEDVRSLQDARDIATRYADAYQTQTIKNYLVGDRIQRQWLVMAAREKRLTPTAEGTSDFKMNMTLAMDGFGGVEHELSLTTIYGDVARLFAESGITYTPTLIVTGAGLAGENLFYRDVDVHADPKLARFLPHEELDRRTLRRTILAHPNQYAVTDVARAARQILDRGGRIGLGAHGQLQGLGAHWELWMLHSGGLTNHQALRVATLYGAEAIGQGGNVGSLEVGKFADLQVLDRDPLADIRNSTSIRWLMINGRLYETETMNEVWPRERGLPRQWWQGRK
ncbi:MAG TPA: amidohydrolase family protein [Gemmatimonadaceae bacterium]|nr:amidohydrolase family protein [Gemmatimonadaceae bacterium]